MTPAARIAAAIDLMDQIGSGALADRALADWGRRNRYAGSKDRAAIGDIVYDVLRKRESYARLGQGETGRALLLGYLRGTGQEPDAIFGADRYAPPALTDAERAGGTAPCDELTDFPDWLWPELERSHGAQARAVAMALRERAPVHLRVNLMKMRREAAIAALAKDGIACAPHPLSPAALEVAEGARRIRNSDLYRSGGVELQDASSQAVADRVPLETGQRLLDLCAGGGGKTLAVAGRVAGRFFAHDVNPIRMKDLPERAARAGVLVEQVVTADLSAMSFDTVLVDAPCSGSGSWRRDPQGKWGLMEKRLRDILDTQQNILDQAAGLVRPGGHLVYATCSLLRCENRDQTAAFLAENPEYTQLAYKQFTPLDGGDGFYCSVLRRA